MCFSKSNLSLAYSLQVFHISACYRFFLIVFMKWLFSACLIVVSYIETNEAQQHYYTKALKFQLNFSFIRFISANLAKLSRAKLC